MIKKVDKILFLSQIYIPVFIYISIIFIILYGFIVNQRCFLIQIIAKYVPSPKKDIKDINKRNWKIWVLNLLNNTQTHTKPIVRLHMRALLHTLIFQYDRHMVGILFSCCAYSSYFVHICRSATHVANKKYSTLTPILLRS